MTADRSLTDLSSVIRLHGRHRPSNPAIVEGDLVVDYAMLDAAIDSMSHHLADRGIMLGMLVGVCLPDNAMHLVSLLALARLGAIALPMDCRWSDLEKRNLAERFSAAFVLVASEGEKLAAHWLVVSPNWSASAEKRYMDPQVRPSTPLLLSLSSGTTGDPTGPMLSHRQFENRFMAYWINLNLSGNDRFVSATPLYFGGGRGFALGLLFAGATVYMFPPPYKPAELIAYVREVKATSLFLVPTLLRRLLESDSGDISLPSVRCLISSGAALFPEERHAVMERITPNLYQLYSSTEAGSIAVLPPSDTKAGGDSVGRPCFRVEVEIVDEAHRPLPVGETGLLRYRSPASPTKYHIGDSSAAFRDGWFYPGDIAMLDSEGYLYLRGRARDMIIRGGVNIYPGDIERILLAMPEVLDVAVIGVPDHEMGENIAAFIVRRGALSENEVAEFCRASLASFKTPSVIRFLDELPKSSGGKVLKRKLYEDYLAELA